MESISSTITAGPATRWPAARTSRRYDRRVDPAVALEVDGPLGAPGVAPASARAAPSGESGGCRRAVDGHGVDVHELDHGVGQPVAVAPSRAPRGSARRRPVQHAVARRPSAPTTSLLEVLPEVAAADAHRAPSGRRIAPSRRSSSSASLGDACAGRRASAVAVALVGAQHARSGDGRRAGRRPARRRPTPSPGCGGTTTPREPDAPGDQRARAAGRRRRRRRGRSGGSRGRDPPPAAARRSAMFSDGHARRWPAPRPPATVPSRSATGSMAARARGRRRAAARRRGSSPGEAAEHEVGVGDRGVRRRPAVGRRAGVGAGALGPDLQEAAAVEAGDGASRRRRWSSGRRPAPRSAGPNSNSYCAAGSGSRRRSRRRRRRWCRPCRA